MAVHASTVETYDNTLIREDLRQQYSMISPEEVPFQQAIGTGEAATNTYHEWSIVSLATPDTSNRVIEGDDAPGVDTATLGVRRGNYTQLSDKQVSVSSTSEAVDAAAENVQKLGKQIILKLKELKRDIESMLLANVAGAAGASGTARASAGFANFLRTNTTLGSGGSLPTLSGTTTGYPDSTVTPGTAVSFTEAMLNTLITAAWTAGASPSMIMVGANNKRVISATFTGNSTRYKDSIDKKIVAAIDIYDSDFGELQVVPNRFIQTMASTTYPVYIIDPDFVELSWLAPITQKELAETGHSKKRLIAGEYTLVVSNEAAHAVHFATTGA